MIDQGGYFLISSVLIDARALSFMMCSSLAVILRIIPCISKVFLRHSNCMSASMCLIINPLALYAIIICLSDVIMVEFVHFLSSPVPKHIVHDVVIMNGISFAYVITTTSVTFWCCSNSLFCRQSYAFNTTLDGGGNCLIPFNDPRFGPRMSSAHSISALLIGKLGKIFFSTYLIKSLVLW